MVLLVAWCKGAANPNPENIEEAPLLNRIRALARAAKHYERGDLSWLDLTAREVIEVAQSSEGSLDAVGAHFFDKSSSTWFIDASHTKVFRNSSAPLRSG